MEGEWWRRRSEAWEGLVRIVMVTVAKKLRRPGRLNNEIIFALASAANWGGGGSVMVQEVGFWKNRWLMRGWRGRGGWWAEEGGGSLAKGRAVLELAPVFYLRRFMSLN